jgi:hypothetical protein
MRWVNSNAPPYHCTPISSLVPLTPLKGFTFWSTSKCSAELPRQGRDCKCWPCCFQSLALAVNVQLNFDTAEGTQCVNVLTESVIG